MSNFKIGDKVKRTGGTVCNVVNGGIYTVTGITGDDGRTLELNDFDDRGYSAASFIKYFEVGDLVRILPFEEHKAENGRHYTKGMIALIGTVSKVSFVIDDDDCLGFRTSGWAFCPEYLELVTTPVETEVNEMVSVLKARSVNVINIKPSKIKKLSDALTKAGYPLDNTWDDVPNTIRIYNDSSHHNHDIGVSTARKHVTIDASTLKVREVMVQLGLRKPKVVNTEPTESTQPEAPVYNPPTERRLTTGDIVEVVEVQGELCIGDVCEIVHDDRSVIPYQIKRLSDGNTRWVKAQRIKLCTKPVPVIEPTQPKRELVVGDWVYYNGSDFKGIGKVAELKSKLSGNTLIDFIKHTGKRVLHDGAGSGNITLDTATGWWCSPRTLELLGTVDHSTPVGTKVTVIDGTDTNYVVGKSGVLTRHDGDRRPRCDYADKSDYWFPYYPALRTLPADWEL